MQPDDTQTLLDEMRIRNVINRYYAGLDRKDPSLFDGVFTPDAVMTALGGERRFEGRPAIVESLMAVRSYGHTAHYPTSQLIDIAGDEASADTFAIAVIVLSQPTHQVIVRGLQYLDKLTRSADGWRIVERQHIPTWQYEVEGTPVKLPVT